MLGHAHTIALVLSYERSRAHVSAPRNPMCLADIVRITVHLSLHREKHVSLKRSKVEQSDQSAYLDALWTRREGRVVPKKPEPESEGISFM